MSEQSWEKTLRSRYGDGIVNAVRAALAVVAALSLKERDHCLVLVFEGASGKGKSITVRMLMPETDQVSQWISRIDDFTPASFVSHAANRTAEDLADIDLLPRVTNKVMLTKELAPLFRDDEKQLRQNFARLTSILDGNGYLSASGTHGQRGYTGNYIFNWIGATTPIPDRTHRIMAQLGNRILFYEIEDTRPSEDELITFAMSYRPGEHVEQCRKAVEDVVKAHFKRYPVNSVDPREIEIPDDLLRYLIRLAKLIAQGRVEITVDDSGEQHVGTPEGPHRVILLLQTLVKGSALIDGRKSVTADDMEIIRHIAFSSLPKRRRELLKAMVESECRWR